MKKLKPYIFTSLTVILILTVLFFVKGIYPFGTNSLIWGDMHDQITAFYYHFYDSFYGSKSLLIDFSTSGGINFVGILAYYILSPFSLLVLLVPRSDIYLMVSVIIAIKILLCSLTCQYFLRKFFKKLPWMLQTALAISYAFSSYGLAMYQITPWIDAMYLFPILMIGLKKILDLEKPTLYVTVLSFSLILSFYVSMMTILFIFLFSFIYLLAYKEKEERKKAVVSLGIFTVLSLLISAVVVVPAYLQISVSYRMGFNLRTLVNSKTGSITDKLSMFALSGILYTGLFILAKNYKKHKQFLSFYIPVLLVVLIPVIVEPIHRILMFGSYACFPYRFGFITMFLLVAGAAYGFNNHQEFSSKMKNSKVFSIIITSLSAVLIAVLIYKYYSRFQDALFKLSLCVDHPLLLILVIVTLTSIIACIFIIKLNKKLNSFSLVLILFITIAQIFPISMAYLGMDKHQQILTKEYVEMAKLSELHDKDDYYRIKNEIDPTEMIANSGMVTKYHNLDHFTSLTNKNNLSSLKKLGYSSMWVKTFSLGSNMFMDSILANKYLITKENLNNEYYKLTNKIDDINFYTLKYNIPYGYLINYNDTIFDKDNSFEISNSLYKNITNKDDNIFTIYDDFKLDNIAYIKKKEQTKYKIINKKKYSFFEKDLDINGKQTVYLEMIGSIENMNPESLYNSLNIYINDKLYLKKAFDEDKNGVLNLGTYEDEKLNIKLELRSNIEIMNLTLGIMDNSKYEEFASQKYENIKIEYNKNKINVTVNGEEDKILFLPIAYSEQYKALNNGKEVEVLKLYDNFIGIKLNKGINNIKISYIPDGLVKTSILSIGAIIITIFIIKSNLYRKMMENELIQKILYNSYVSAYLLAVFMIYVVLTVCFIISYFIPIRF